MRKPFVKPVVRMVYAGDAPLLTGSNVTVRFDVSTDGKGWEKIEIEF